jgi:chromosomal replication initiation ATPase DnaA
MTAVPPRQLALALPHAESLTRDNFLEGPSNSAALHLVERWPDWPNRVMLLMGPEASGKSHLATIWAELSGARTISAHALEATDVPATLATNAVVVEDVETGAFDERALFHLLNLAREQDAYVLLTARHSPADGALRDLNSRLRAVPMVALAPPDDPLLRALIVKFCADRQLSIDELLVSYVASRIERSFVAARRAVERLDGEALRLGRPLTRALAAELLRDE